jgi:hypothetical protein
VVGIRETRSVEGLIEAVLEAERGGQLEGVVVPKEIGFVKPQPG